MNRIITLLGILLSTLILVGCAVGRYPYPKTELGPETWRGAVETSSRPWALKADQWFLEGALSPAAMQNRFAPVGEAISRQSVRVSNFHNIRINGDFQVQLVGVKCDNYVTIDGPNEKVRALSIGVDRDVLFIEQSKKAPPGMGQVVVRIGIKQLRELVHNGQGSVEGIRLMSDSLNVMSSGCGNVFLAGHLNTRKIIAKGPGTINIFTIEAYNTIIETMGYGSVNLDAKRGVWLTGITHQGTGNINVIGARSQSLTINTVGSGKIGLHGNVNIREIRASGKTCVLIDDSTSDLPCIYVYDEASVGIAGRAGIFTAYTTRNSHLWTRYLVAHTAYVEASGQSHMNVYATNKIFARANDYATVYYYGNPGILSPFENGDGVVIDMGTPTSQFEVITRKRNRAGCRVARETGPAHYFWRRGRVESVTEVHRYV